MAWQQQTGAQAAAVGAEAFWHAQLAYNMMLVNSWCRKMLHAASLAMALAAALHLSWRPLTAACCRCSPSDDGLDEEAVYGLDDSDSDEGESSDEGEEGDSEDALEEALLRGGRHAQREC